MCAPCLLQQHPDGHQQGPARKPHRRWSVCPTCDADLLLTLSFKWETTKSIPSHNILLLQHVSLVMSTQQCDVMNLQEQYLKSTSVWTWLLLVRNGSYRFLTQFRPGINICPEASIHPTALGSGLNAPKCVQKSDHCSQVYRLFNNVATFFTLS